VKRIVFKVDEMELAYAKRRATAANRPAMPKEAVNELAPPVKGEIVGLATVLGMVSCDLPNEGVG
jgi:hypothetical protein